MKSMGKVMLFFSSHILLVLVLLFTEVASLVDSNEKLPSIILVVFYSIAILLAILSTYGFIKNYAFGSIKRTTKISIKSVSNGSQELISYLITMIVPFGVISSSILSDGWLRLTVMVCIFLFLLTLYVNTNLVVINPTLAMCGYTINKIRFNYPRSDIEVEGILLTKNLNLMGVSSQTMVDMIDKDTFIIRRI